jgi:hypothetical protein
LRSKRQHKTNDGTKEEDSSKIEDDAKTDDDSKRQTEWAAAQKQVLQYFPTGLEG